MPATHPVELDRMLRAPLACAFFLLADSAGLGVSDLCRPDLALDVAALARRQLDPWTDYAEDARHEVLARAGSVERLARATLTDPRTRWWSEPLRPDRQLWLGSSSDGALRVVEPAGEPTWFEMYAQRPRQWFFTATEFAGRSGLHATQAYQVGDWDPSYPLRCARLEAAASPRVYEINSAEDWRALAVRYRAAASAESTDSAGGGLVGGAAPVWAAVARDWDAVHLTFGGFLSAIYVVSGPPEDATTLWTWDCEQTLWLRDHSRSWFEMPSLIDRPQPLLGPVPFQLRAAEPGGSEARQWLRNG